MLGAAMAAPPAQLTASTYGGLPLPAILALRSRLKTPILPNFRLLRTSNSARLRISALRIHFSVCPATAILPFAILFPALLKASRRMLRLRMAPRCLLHPLLTLRKFLRSLVLPRSLKLCLRKLSRCRNLTCLSLIPASRFLLIPLTLPARLCLFARASLLLLSTPRLSLLLLPRH